MRTPGEYRWRELYILAGVPLSVIGSWLSGMAGWAPLGNINWLLEWGIGFFYAVGVLCPLGWYRSQSLVRTLAAVLLSVLAWHWAVYYAAASYESDPDGQHLPFLGRSVLSGGFGALLVSALPLGRACFPGWERRWAWTGLVGAWCGGQMGLLCLWRFDIGFWLGMAGWQLAVTAFLLHGTAPQRAGKSLFWPAPPQLTS